MYSVLDYGLMATDGVRMSAYARAIERAVKPGSVVLDLGSGTGIFSLLAARAGARHVHAVDINPAVWVAKDLAMANGFGDRISVYEASAFDVQLPEQVDVIVSDMRGKTALSGSHLAAIQDAKTRWLKPGGVVIPSRDRLFVGVVEVPELAAYLANGWQSCEDFGFDFAAARTSILNSVYADRPHTTPASSLLTTSESWATITFAGDNPDVFTGTAKLEGRRRGTAHGLAVWFEATVFEELAYSSEPGQELAYSRQYLPFLEPVKIAEADRVEVSLSADARGTRWSWATSIRDKAGNEKARFRQATFLGMPTSPAALLRSAASAQPRISPRGERMRRLLALLDGRLTTSEIVAELSRELDPSDPLRARIEDEVRDAIGSLAL